MSRDPKTGQPPASTSFDAAAVRLFDAFPAGEATAVNPQDLETVSSGLSRQLQGRYGLPDADVDEIVQDVILGVLTRARDQGLNEIQNPGAWLTRLSLNRAIDHMRRHARRDVELSAELSEVLLSHDDEIAALLDATATAALVRAAMRAASQARDDLTLRVVSTWLDLADELGEPPSSRVVAERAGVSHTSVNHALKRFRSYLPTH